jgi:hypothetical protein
VRTRFDNKWQKTRGNLDVRKIVNIVGQFPTLHAFGVGFEQFRSIPEARRSQCIDYARYMLAFELDDEIDGAAAFLKAIGVNIWVKDDNYVRSDYLHYLYGYWRKGSTKHPKDMPIGVFAMAALILKSRIRIVEDIKPHFLVPVTIDKRSRVEHFLSATEGFEPWPEEDVLWKF